MYLCVKFKMLVTETCAELNEILAMFQQWIPLDNPTCLGSKATLRANIALLIAAAILLLIVGQLTLNMSRNYTFHHMNLVKRSPISYKLQFKFDFYL